LASAWLANSSPAAAADIYVLSAAAMQPVFNEIVGDFEGMTEHKVIIRYANLGAAITRTLPDESADLVIGSRQLISDLARQGRIRPDIQLTICKTGGGVVMSAGIPRDAPQSEATSGFVAFLVSAKALAVMKAKGMELD
jgi:ABC-type molybdate transport system substrate-binding protein